MHSNYYYTDKNADKNGIGNREFKQLLLQWTIVNTFFLSFCILICKYGACYASGRPIDPRF